MTIAINKDLEALISEEAKKRGSNPTAVINEILRKEFKSKEK